MTYFEVRQKVNDGFNSIGNWFLDQAKDFISATGELCRFAGESTALIFRRPFRWTELVTHMEFIGNKSVLIILLSGLFTGMALAFQIFLGFKLVNATSLVGPTVGLGIWRELGPVLAGLIVSARAGGAMAARIGTMRVTEQIDALEVMGVNPLHYLVSPRIFASVIVLPILTGLIDFIAMFGCWVIVVGLLDQDEAQFWEVTSRWLQPYHLYEGLFKAALFGYIFAVICSHRGYTTKGGAAGVGSATNKGVVLSMVMIIIIDFFATNLINIFYQWKATLWG